MLKQDAPKAGGESLVEDIKSNFVPTDDFNRDFSGENERVMNDRASLLIASALNGGRFAPFMKAGKNDKGRWFFALEEPVRHVVTQGADTYEFVLKDFEFQLGGSCAPFEQVMPGCYSTQGYGCILPQPALMPECRGLKEVYDRMWDGQGGLKSLFNLRMDVSLAYKVNGHSHSANPQDKADLDTANGKTIPFANVIKAANNIFHERSLFDICKDITPYDTPEKVCRFFGAEWTPYGALKAATHAFRLDQFHHCDDTQSPEIEQLRPHNRNCSEEDLVEYLLDAYVGKNQRDFALNAAFCKTYGGWLKQAYAFRNEHGEIVQQAIKLVDWENDTKRLVPCTTWMRDYHTLNEQFCVPLPQKQILYNLDLLKGLEAPTVILTDSIEIAALNQLERNPQVVWTSWLCDDTTPDAYGHVDWSPLEGNEQVFYLITNHSGQSLADAYEKADKLAQHLEGRHGVKLRFIQAQVKFPERRPFKDLSTAMAHRKDNKPAVVVRSVQVLATSGEFEEMLGRARQASLSPAVEFWDKDAALGAAALDSGDDKDDGNGGLKPIDYLMRPIITRGEVSMLHAHTGLGKSCLAFSVCAAVVSGRQLFPGKWWVSPKPAAGPRKVLYLDFELGAAQYARRRKSFVDPYLPADASGNFIVKDLKGTNVKYTDAANHQLVLDFMEEAKGQGVEGQPVDLVVFDTYTKLVGAETSMSWDKVAPLLGKITAKGAGALLVHHSIGEEGKSRGFSNKDDNFYAKVKLGRADGSKGTLAAPLRLELEKLRDGFSDVDYEAFDILFDGKRWAVPHPPEFVKAEEIKAFETLKEHADFGPIVEAYQNAGYQRKAICQMMGVGKTTYHDRMNEYRQLRATEANLKKPDDKGGRPQP